MEFTIDLVLVERIIAEENLQARHEIAKRGAIAACQAAGDRHDRRVAQAADTDTLACKAGCSWCCNFLIDVRAVEVFNIIDFMQREFTPETQARIKSQIAANEAMLAPLDDDERMQRNVPCAFLSAGKCTIYAARPQTCRNYHATDVAGCRQSFEEPANLDIDPEFAPVVYQTGGAHVDGFAKALSASLYDTGVYEFNAALSAALADPGSRERFEARELPFPAVRRSQVGYQFIDEPAE